ncbi:ATP-dependent RNA helicase [Phanerochaete sordida]|uniref:ATP-dependent RNA helicase n=1 Tax=Phanerochaete sordida TaxID=48140 RepID=A0A9P3G0S9_9APHY|nr:ATP-dependent RNA helicase [Phanerochaete sordida]
MSQHPLHSSAQASSSGGSLKRPYAQPGQSRPSSSSSTTQTPAGGLASTPLDRPAKAPKVDIMQKQHYSSAAPALKARGGGSSGFSSRPSGRNTGKGKGKGKSTPQKQPSIQGPLYDEKYITETYKTRPVKSEWEANPKSPVANWSSMHTGSTPKYEAVRVLGPNGMVWRSTLTVKGETDDETISAIGDHPASRKDAERLAAMCAMYQMDAKGFFERKPSASGRVEESPVEAVLSDGSTVSYDKARQFMDYYCRRFGFGRPDVEYVEQRGKGTSGWDAVMTVGGRKIGMGSGGNKKHAMMACYVDVTRYLEECDKDLWKKFVDDARTGKDLGMAVPVRFSVDQRVEDQIGDLCMEIKRSSLYKNRPRIRSLMTGSDDPSSLDEAPQPQKYVAPYRRQADEEALAAKSQLLQERRKKYLEDPEMEKMRTTRAQLPVYTKAEDLLAHIDEHDVTICMAATGSGKTTQIPQLILDQWIDKGDGAKCNIVCTQPRRIAAISVAQRVSAERGEVVGRGSIGYQVRFESKIPEDNGSVTFCTTGIFLKRMQSSLESGSRGRNLDDVTHIVVDEVHERDVDTDLLLVVLKRLLADRKAKGKPIKVVLMSATIDPKLFCEYFPDKQGQPASVIDIPGRSFPVQKHFLDEYLPEVLQSSGSAAQWVCQEDSVRKYISQELGGNLPNLPVFNSFRQRYPQRATSSDEDLELPYPFIALTISHVLQKTDDGHVLVFLPGWDDIVRVQRALQTPRGGSWPMDFNSSQYEIHCLHSTVPLQEQQKIFDPAAPGVRRIILATNIAETSVTIPDVVYVVDSAKVKEQRYDPERHISSLVSAWVGSSNLNQRAGRAGRHRAGEYYGILGRQRADNLHPHQTVEMKRVDLSNVVMHVKALNFPAMTVEEVLANTIEPPPVERVEAAMNTLQMVGALDGGKNLTSLGRVLLQLPIDAQMGRLVLFGSFFRCLDQALTLAAVLTNRDPFVSPMHLKDEANARKNSFCPEDFRSDALATLNAYNQWWAMQSREEYVRANKFCIDNFLSKPTLLMIQKIKAHILQSLYDIGVIEVSAGGVLASRPPRTRGAQLAVPPELNKNGGSNPLLAALIAIAVQPKFAVRSSDKTYRTAQDKTVFIHPSSVNHRKRLDRDEGSVLEEKHIIAYAEKRQNLSSAGASANAQKFLVNTTRLDPLTYMLFGAHRVEVTRRGLDCDEWLPVVGDLNVLDDVEHLKIMLESCLLRVFEGITKLRAKRAPPLLEGKEDESGDEDDDIRDLPLSVTEIKELDFLASDVVGILNNYGAYRAASQSRPNTRPATPMDSPFWSASMLPPSGASGARSGYSTPRYMSTNAVNFSSRPGTPSRLSRR